MNKFIKAIKRLDSGTVEMLLQKESKWVIWAEESGKKTLHYLCGMTHTKGQQQFEAFKTSAGKQHPLSLKF